MGELIIVIILLVFIIIFKVLIDYCGYCRQKRVVKGLKTEWAYQRKRLEKLWEK